VEDSCQYIEQAVADGRHRVVLRLGQRLLSSQSTKYYTALELYSINLTGRNYLKDLGIDMRIILKRISKEWGEGYGLD
jgi:hypothetical protein